MSGFLDWIDNYVPHSWTNAINHTIGPSPEPVTPGTAMPGPAASMPIGPDGRPMPVNHDTLPDFIRSRWAASMNAGVSPDVAASMGPDEAAGTYRGGSTTAGVMTDFYACRFTCRPA